MAFSSNDDLPARLLALPKYGKGSALARMRFLIQSLPRPLPPVLHVVGSNGKGSTAAYAAALLQGLGLKVGLYTSPHLFRFHERFQVNGVPIADKALAQAHAFVAGHLATWYTDRKDHGGYEVHKDEEAGAFEVYTAMACHYFVAQGVDVIVAEAGIGGKLDPTREMGGSVALLTSVDLEHTQLLGNTLAAIAADKAQVLAGGGRLIAAALPAEVRNSLRAVGAAHGIVVDYLPDSYSLESYEVTGGRALVTATVGAMALEKLSLGMVGEHMAHNAMLALAGIMAMARQLNLPGVDWPQLAHKVLPGVTVAGRLQQVAQGPDVWVDVAHTPAAITALARGLERMGHQRWVLLVGVSAGRDAAALLGPLASMAAEVVLTEASHRAQPAEEVRGALRNWPCPLHVSVPWQGAFALAKQRATALGLPLLVCGGLFLPLSVGHWVLTGQDDLKFF